MARLRRILTTLVLAAALLPLGASAVPADTTDAAATLDKDVLERAKILRLLNSDAPEEQERAVRLIGHYAHTDQYDEAFFSTMVTPLHYIVARGETEALRIMAVSALYSIGTEKAMNGLAVQVDALRSERVRKVTRTALDAYDGNLTDAEQRQTAE